MATSSRHVEHVAARVVIAILAAAAVGGLLAGWYEQIDWYDESVHVWFGFAASFAAGLWLSNKARSLATAHTGSFAFVLVGLGLGIGAAWELLEFAYDHLSGERNLILGKIDTMTDLLCDLGGAIGAAGVWALRANRPPTSS